LANDFLVTVIVPVLAIVVPCLSLFVGKRFERGEKETSRINSSLEQLDERITMCEMRLQRIVGRLNGK
jgi:hypothetical protein